MTNAQKLAVWEEAESDFVAGLIGWVETFEAERYCVRDVGGEPWVFVYHKTHGPVVRWLPLAEQMAIVRATL